MATKVLTSSQLTFVDITDQRKLSAYLTSNLTTVQQLKKKKFYPSWAEKNLVITPHVFIDQQALKLSEITTIWKRKDGNSEETELKENEKVEGNVLTVSANYLDTADSGMITYICYVTYTDPETEQTVNITDRMTYTLLRAAEDAKTCFISGPQVFKYDKDGVCAVDHITLEATLQGVVIKGWQYYDPVRAQYYDYPDNTQNTNPTSSVWHVYAKDPVFDSSGVAKIKVLTQDEETGEDSVYDVITISKLYDGTIGPTGATGAAGCTVLLTNESYTFPGDETTAKESSVDVTVIVYQGADEQFAYITTVDGVEVKYGGDDATGDNTSENGGSGGSGEVTPGVSGTGGVRLPTKTKGLEFSVEGQTITFYADTTLVGPSGKIPIEIMTHDLIKYKKVFAWNIAFAGVGARSVSIEASSQIFKSTDGVSYTPDTITLTPHVQNLYLPDIEWKYSLNGGGTWTKIENIIPSSTDVYYDIETRVLTIPKGFTGYKIDVTSIVFRCVNGKYTDSVTVAKLADGQSATAAYTVMLSNEMQGIATYDTMIPLETKTFECVVTAYEGSAQLTATNDPPGEGFFRVVLPSTRPEGIQELTQDKGIVRFQVKDSRPIPASGSIDLTIQTESEKVTILKSISYVASKSGTDGSSAVTFMIWAPDGDVFSNQEGTLKLAARMYLGAANITGSGKVSFQWYKFTKGEYVPIEDVNAKKATYIVTGSEVTNIQTYKCVATYDEEEYEAFYTVTDMSDTYLSEMLTIGGTTFKNGQGGSAVYVIVRANGVEKDPFPSNCSISTTAPLNPTEGTYWWKLDTNSVQLMKYNGTTWVATAEDDDPQQFKYIWSLMDKDGKATKFSKTGKVIYLSCNDIYSIGTLQCDVQKKQTT